MSGGDPLPCVIAEQHRQAISGRDRTGNTPVCGGRGIRFGLAVYTFSTNPGSNQVATMHLSQKLHPFTARQSEGVNGKPEADASSTTDRGIACAVTTADCLPVMFCDDAGERIAAAHAGWRGLAAGILLRTLRAFPDPQRVSAYLAPAIGPKAFEVGPEVREAFATAPEGCFRPGQGDRLFADLPGLARWQLRNAGIGSVFGGGQCTFSDSERFFSYRRDGRTGRQLSLIWKTR